MKQTQFYIIIFIFVLISFSHISAKDELFDDNTKNNHSTAKSSTRSSQRILSVVQFAKDLVGSKSRYFSLGDSTFRGDCSGFVSYVFASQNIYLIDGSVNFTARQGLVYGIFLSMKKNHKIHYNKHPKIGDIVFFHNTFDMNRDGRVNDHFTHIGVVESVATDGTIYFIHYFNPWMGVSRDRMNLYYPNSIYKNSYVRSPRYHNPGGQYLSGQLFAGFGTIKS